MPLTILRPSGRRAWSSKSQQQPQSLLRWVKAEDCFRNGFSQSKNWGREEITEGCSRQSFSCAGSQRKPGSGNMSYRAPVGGWKPPVAYLSREENNISERGSSKFNDCLPDSTSLISCAALPPPTVRKHDSVYHPKHSSDHVSHCWRTSNNSYVSPYWRTSNVSYVSNRLSPNLSEYGALLVKKVYNLCAQTDL